MTPEEIKQLTPGQYVAVFEPTAQEAQPDINLSDYTLEPFYEHNVLRGYLLKKEKNHLKMSKQKNLDGVKKWLKLAREDIEARYVTGSDNGTFYLLIAVERLVKYIEGEK